jgi:hypothetical protein
MIKSGKASIDPLAWIGKSKEEFFAAVKGYLAHDKNEVWEQVQKAIENESISSISESNKSDNSTGSSKASKRK